MPQQQHGLIKLLEEMKAREERHFEGLQDWKNAEPQNSRVDDFIHYSNLAIENYSRAIDLAKKYAS
jgi:hypothetical protein